MSSLRLIANEIRVIYIICGVVILLSFIAPYSHIFFDKASTIKVFGFNNLRTFMYTIGLPCSILVCSYLLIISNMRAKTKLNRVAGYLFLYSSIFHSIWLFVIRAVENRPMTVPLKSMIFASSTGLISCTEKEYQRRARFLGCFWGYCASPQWVEIFYWV